MPGMNVQMRSVRSIFRDDYAIGAFQRGYSWEHENVAIMLRDFARAFERRRRSEVSGDYYLGTVVTHAREGYRHIIDGQQRLTTLLLLLIWAAHELRDIDRRLAGLLLSLIVHQGPRGACFAIDVDERISVFRALFDDPSLNQGLELENDTDRIIVDRFHTIAQTFPENLKGDQFKKFVEWMLDHVQMAVVDVEKESDAYTIFETTNDRGQKLGSGQLTKNLLQSQISDTDLREDALVHWTKTMRDMQRFGMGGDRDFFQEWLIARHAELPVVSGRVNDPDLIEDDHFAWIKANMIRLNLLHPDECYRFMRYEMAAMADAYVRVRESGEFPRRGWDSLYFLNQLGITWARESRMVMLSTVDVNTSLEDTIAKLRAAATFMEIFSARYYWSNVQNNRLTPEAQTFLQRTAALLRSAREVEHAVEILQDQLDVWPMTFRTNMEAGLPPAKGAGPRARKVTHTLLARMSACFDEAFGQLGAYPHYELRSQNRGYTIEHVLPSEGGRGGLLGGSDKNHQRKRNRFGALLLVSAIDNQRLGDAPYSAKRELYQNMTRLARTFHPSFYEGNTQDRLDQLGLNFRYYSDFTANDVDERQEAYIRLAELTWNLDRVAFVARRNAEEDSRVHALPPWPSEDML
jgi:hypothetical protein